MSIITPDGIMTPNCVPHVTTNSTAHIQAQISKYIPKEPQPHVHTWVHDILAHSKTFGEVLSAIRRLFQLFIILNFKFHPAKCSPFTVSVRWYGLIISEHGIRFDLRWIDGLREMQTPTSGAQIRQFVCPCNVCAILFQNSLKSSSYFQTSWNSSSN